jgi:L-alanine-DL-glutamate epimerase-like enolase superfamily enzyme
MIHAFFKKHTLKFKLPGGTSRGILTEKETWFLIIRDADKLGIGECGMFRGLSADDRPDFEARLQWVCDHIELGEAILLEELREFPAIQLGLETAFRSFASEDPFQIYPSQFSKGNAAIAINGLIWMGDEVAMRRQISAKLEEGFGCIKIKIGAIDFDKELSLLRAIRKQYGPTEIELRVDANGAFSVAEVDEKLRQLSELQLHSIEQPIKAGQWQEMARLCEDPLLPIALDEELIGIFDSEEKQRLITTVKPQYIIIKPTLVGGFSGSDEWIAIATKSGSGWWLTSALESNVGLNAISQFTFVKNSKLPQGLGTGGLFTNNIDSPLEVRQGALHYNSTLQWSLDLL